jgi:hypothetical protein
LKGLRKETREILKRKVGVNMLFFCFLEMLILNVFFFPPDVFVIEPGLRSNGFNLE